ncbi:MAG: DUF1648 domain-containing protein [Clostridia bacterium]|nr:DUF1648 domain-containing protein [Clostridia bacterium]
MKFIKWKSLLLTCAACLVPIAFGVIIWNHLPDKIAIHFDMYNNPDNFSSKGFVVFALPVLMVFLQVFCCFINDINSHKHGERKKFERATKLIIPVMTNILQLVTFAYALGYNIDIRRIVSIIVGCVFLIIGNYLPKFDYIKNYNIDTGKARKINRFMGFECVIMGIVFIASIFFPPIATVISLILLIPYSVIGIIYGIVVGRR